MFRFLFVSIFCFLLCACKEKQAEKKIYPPVGPMKEVIPITSSDTCVTFVVLGDWGKFNDSLSSVIATIEELGALRGFDNVLTAGDNFYESGVASTTDPLWDNWHTFFDDELFQVPWYPSLGNHDHYGNEEAQIEYSQIDPLWVLPSAYHAKVFSAATHPNILSLTVIDTYPLRSMDEEQLSWIQSSFESTQATWKIVLGHHPLFSYGHHGPESILIEDLEPLFIEHQIDAYICGHEHDMQHIQKEQGPEYFISGSAAKIRPSGSGDYSLFDASRYGFAYMIVSHHQLAFYFIANDGMVLYSYILTK